MKKKKQKKASWRNEIDAEPISPVLEGEEPEEDPDEEEPEGEECTHGAQSGGIVISAVDALRESQRITDYFERRLHLEGLINSTASGEGGRSNAVKLADDIVHFNWADDDAEAEFKLQHPGEPLPERIPIKIFIDSAGGSQYDTMRLVEKILKSKTPVWTIADGLCASGGFYVFIAGHRRICSEFTTFLTHEGFLTRDYNDSFDAVVRMATHFAKFHKHKIQPFVRSRIKTEVGLRAYKKRLHSEWYFTADKALRYGIADEIAEDFSLFR